MKSTVNVAGDPSLAESTIGRRRRLAPVLSVAVPLAGLVVIVSLLLLLLTDVSPVTAARALYEGSVGSIFSLTNTAIRAIPISFVAIGATVALRAGVFNVGGEGQLAIGALGAFVALTWLHGLPVVIVWGAAAVVGIIGGASWALLPAWLAVRRGVSEILSTLIMNYVGIGVVTWLTLEDWAFHAPVAVVAQSDNIDPELEFPLLVGGTRLHAGLFILLATLALATWYVGTRRGFLDEIQGQNPRLASLAGVNIQRNRMILLLGSAGVVGLAGFVQIAGAAHLLTPGITGGVGFTGLLVAVLGRSRPVPSVLVAFLFAALLTSGDALEGVGVARPLVVVITALIVIAGALPQFRLR